ncbi:MAG: hypothetical protein EXQ63_04185 [Ilumatobacteraceae bacterium]|nr:hypothetical protein [Ilumatobacteraceae bacterium]
MPHQTPVSISGSTKVHDPGVLVISCDTCVMAATEACSDCMMNVLCDTEHHGAVVLDIAEFRAVRLLAKAGLVPTLRHHANGHDHDTVFLATQGEATSA